MQKATTDYAALVRCDRIFYDEPFNCRDMFSLDSVERLAATIEQVGRLISPISVQPVADVQGYVPDGYDFRLIAGFRRYKAVTFFLKWEFVPVTVCPGLTEHQAHLINFTENIERKDLNPLEEAMAIGKIYPPGTSVRHIAKELGKDVHWVHPRVRILKLPASVQQLVAARRVTLLDLELVFQYETDAARIECANEIAASKHGRGPRPATVTKVENKLARSFKRKKHKREIDLMVARLLDLGIETRVSAARALVWAAGHISDEEFEQDISSAIETI